MIRYGYQFTDPGQAVRHRFDPGAPKTLCDLDIGVVDFTAPDPTKAVETTMVMIANCGACEAEESKREC